MHPTKNNLFELLAECDTCDRYAAQRLATVALLWFRETGRRARLGPFMRHQAGHSIGRRK